IASNPQYKSLRSNALLGLYDPAATELYTLSLHDALPIWCRPFPPRSARGPCPRSRGSPVPPPPRPRGIRGGRRCGSGRRTPHRRDRKSTRLNSSHVKISYAVFCLKKKNVNTVEQCGEVCV